MRVVLTGATGFVGGHVLARLVADPDVERITCLTRRPLPGAPAPSVDPVVLDDFERCPDDLAADLREHDAVIWALGGKESDVRDPTRYTRVTHDFTLALASIVATAPRVTFCYLSGALADPTGTARLPWERETRLVKGRTEADLGGLAARHPGLTVHCFRPAGVLPTTTVPALAVLAAPISVRVDRLAEALVAVATGRVVDAPGTISNRGLKRIAARGRRPSSP